MPSHAAVKVLQINLGRSRTAHDLAFAHAAKTNADILVISEPNKKIASKGNWLVDLRKDAAIYCRNKNVDIESHKRIGGAVVGQLLCVAQSGVRGV